MARVLMEEKEPTVKNRLTKQLKNLIRSVCNCVSMAAKPLSKRNHVIDIKMILNAIRVDDFIWNDYRLYSTTIKHIDTKSWNLGKCKKANHLKQKKKNGNP